MSNDDKDHVTEKSGTVIWDVATEAPELLGCLPESVKASLEAIRKTGTVLTARSTIPFDDTSCFRPARHVRAFYQRVTDWQKSSDAVIAYKGGEAWANNLGAVVAEMSQGRSCLNKNDFFVVQESKVPIGYLTHEALGDAQKAAALFRAVHGTFKNHPKLPLPLCVVKWPARAVEGYRDTVTPYLSSTTKEMVLRLLQDGLAQYVYFYPGSPLRLRHAQRTPEQVADIPATMRLIDEWVTLFVQILCSGYAPMVLSNQKWGACVQDQNVCMSGGFVDVDSVQPLTEDPNMFAANLLASVQLLAHSIYVLLHPLVIPEVGSAGVLHVDNVFGGSLHQMLFFPHVWKMVERKFNDLSATVKADKRLVAIFGAASTGDHALVELLQQLALMKPATRNAAVFSHVFGGGGWFDRK